MYNSNVKTSQMSIYGSNKTRKGLVNSKIPIPFIWFEMNTTIPLVDTRNRIASSIKAM
jgi:hypothetical protein